MSDFAGNEELLHDFLTEANELLADLDNRLVDLEKTPEEAALLNSVFRNFHTIKGGAGFVNLPMLVRALTYRNEPLSAVAEKALSGGREGVIRINTGPT